MSKCDKVKIQDFPGQAPVVTSWQYCVVKHNWGWRDHCTLVLPSLLRLVFSCFCISKTDPHKKNKGTERDGERHIFSHILFSHFGDDLTPVVCVCVCFEKVTFLLFLLLYFVPVTRYLYAKLWHRTVDFFVYVLYCLVALNDWMLWSSYCILFQSQSTFMPRFGVTVDFFIFLFCVCCILL